MAAKTVAERQSEAEQLMRSGFGVTAIVDEGSDTLQVKRPTSLSPGDEKLPEAARTKQTWLTYAGGAAKIAYLG
jgi:hypothetical protein